jgi:hypothetical protein
MFRWINTFPRVDHRKSKSYPLIGTRKHYDSGIDIQEAINAGCVICSILTGACFLHTPGCSDIVSRSPYAGACTVGLYFNEMGYCFILEREVHKQNEEKVFQQTTSNYDNPKVVEDTMNSQGHPFWSYLITISPARTPEDCPDRSQILRPQPDDFLSLAKRWLTECHTSHQRCRDVRVRTLPTRLLRVLSDSVQLIDTAQLSKNVDYATLSHSWGSLRFFTLSTSNL